MMICSKCRREMACVKTGRRVHYGGGHVYAGDEFSCMECGATVVKTNDVPYFDPEFKTFRQEEAINMEERN